MKLGTISNCNAKGETAVIEYNEVTHEYMIFVDNKKDAIVLKKEEMKKLYDALEKIENYQ